MKPNRTSRPLPHALLELLRFHHEFCAPYREILHKSGVDAQNVESYHDWLRIPTLSKELILDNPPWGFVSGARSAVARLLETSGSTGTPKVLPISLQENQQWVELTRRYLSAAGFESGATTMTIFPQGPWPSGYLIAGGSETIGPTYTADVNLPDEWYVKKIALYRPRHIGTLPSFMTRLARIVERAGLNVEFVRAIVIGGEHLYPRQRNQIRRVFAKARLVEGYGSAEIGIAATECSSSHGLHFYEDKYFVEILNQDNDKPALPGEVGELVISPLFRRTAPIIRYRTGDWIRQVSELPRCELSQFPLYTYILSRCDDVLVMGSCKVFPSDIEASIREHPNLSDSHFTLHLETDAETLLPRLRLQCELLRGGAEENGISESLIQSLTRNSHAFSYGVTSGLAAQPVIEILPAGTLYRDQCKHRRFVDDRSVQERDALVRGG